MQLKLKTVAELNVLKVRAILTAQKAVSFAGT